MPKLLCVETAPMPPNKSAAWDIPYITNVYAKLAQTTTWPIQLMSVF